MTSVRFAALVVGMVLTAACSAKPPFVAENNTASARMMKAMHAKPLCDADTEFVRVMVAHHQGAIDMARTELRYGRNPQLLRIAQEIIVTQQQEIAAMQLAIGQPPSTQQRKGP